MNNDKKTFNFNILFIIIYAILAICVLVYIWWPKSSDSIFSQGNLKYDNVDEKQRGIETYKLQVESLLLGQDMPALYAKLDDGYKKEHNINEENYKSFFEGSGLIAKSYDIDEDVGYVLENNITMGGCTINIQGGDVYVYRYDYTCDSKKCYVNVIETRPYEYTISFEQDTIPIVDDSLSEDGIKKEVVPSSNTKVTEVDNITYEVSKSTIRSNGITYTLKITNKSDKNAEYNFDNVTNVTAKMSDGKIVYLGGAVITSEDYNIAPGGYIQKELFFAVDSSDQDKIEKINIQNVKIGDDKKTVSINV